MFGRRYFLTSDLEDWHVECWAWNIRHIPDALALLRDTPFILPTKEFFPPTENEGHERAEYLLRTVMSTGPTESWPIFLEPQDEIPGRDDVRNVVRTEGMSACGTFRIEGNRAIISYDPSMVGQAEQLIATLAHEVSHYLNGQFPEEAPGSDEFIEPATDVTAAFLGYGVFLANSRFDFSNWQDGEMQGWGAQTRGYLTEAEWAFSIAMYSGLSGHPIEDTKPYLKSHIWPQVRKAKKYIEKWDLAEAVRDAALLR